MKRTIAVLLGILVGVVVGTVAHGQAVEHTFSRADVPQSGIVSLRSVDFSTTQVIDVGLPSNLRFVLGDVFVKSTDVDTLSAGAVMAVSEYTKAGVLVQALAPSKTLSAASVNGSVEEATRVAASAGGVDMAYILNAAAATVADAVVTVTNLVAATNAITIADGAITDPVYPRNAVFVVTDDSGAATNLSGSVVVTGTDMAGNAATETLTKAAGSTATLTGSVAFKRITSVVYTFLNGAEADTLAMGYGVKLALPVDKNVQKAVAVLRSTVDGTVDAATLDAVNGTVTMNTAPNGTRDYDIVYSYSGPSRPAAINGSNVIRVGITGSTATNDMKDVVMHLYAF